MINLSSPKATYYINKVNGKIDSIKVELNKEMRYIAQGAMLRGRVCWYEEGEKTKHFFALKKNRSHNKQMCATKLHSSEVSRNANTILNQQSEFYKKLYTSDPSVRFMYKNSENKLSDDVQQRLLNSEINLSEIAMAIKEMPRNRMPGSDGLPVDFYKMFYVKLKILLMALFEHCFKVGRLHSSARKGVITLILKKDRDLLLIKNWCPITLLCCDYKIISKVIATRIQVVLQNLIAEDQTGFLKGRSISSNIRKSLNIQEYCTKKQLTAVMIMVDFNFFGFNKLILKWVDILFRDMELCTINHGYTSPYFIPTRGIFQGNPIGPYAFITLIELLAIQLRKKDDIKRIKIAL